MPAVHDHGHINIDNVAILQALLAWDAVADDMVYRCADGFGIAPVAEGRRYCTGNYSHVVAQAIKLVRADAWNDIRRNIIENFGGQSPGFSHRFEFGRAVNLNAAFDNFSAIQGSVRLI